MPPSQKLIQVAEFFVKLVVLCRTDQNDVIQAHRRFSNRIRQGAYSGIGTDSFAVLNATLHQLARDSAIHVNPGNHQRSEEVAFPAFIHAEMRLEHFRRMNLFVAKLRLAQNLRLELKLHKFFHSFALDQSFWSLLVNCDAKFIFLGEKEGVLFWRKFETELFEQRAKFAGLFSRQRLGVGIQTPNVQLPERNVQSSSELTHWTLGVERWTFASP